MIKNSEGIHKASIEKDSFIILSEMFILFHFQFYIIPLI